MMNVPRFFAFAGVITIIAGSSVCASKILMLHDNFPSSSEVFYTKLKLDVEKAGFNVEEVDGEKLASRLASEPGPGTILILPNAPYFPADAVSALDGFLKRKNHLYAVSGPALEMPVVKSNGVWLNRDEAKERLTDVDGETVVDFARQDVSQWIHYFGTADTSFNGKIEETDNPQTPRVMHIEVNKLQDWVVLEAQKVEQSFPKDCIAMTFWAKGDKDTKNLEMQWAEKDGSRWIAAIKLTDKWQRYILTGNDFKLWLDRVPQGRGKDGDKLNLENASVMSLIYNVDSGNGSTKGTPRNLWISDIKAAKGKLDIMTFTPPVLETICPPYKMYRTQATGLSFLDDGTQLPVDTEVVAPHLRTFGYGSESLRKWRYIPLMNILDKTDEYRGMGAHLALQVSTAYSGSIWGYIGLNQDFLETHSDTVVPHITSMLRQMSQGVFFANAGTDKFGYASGDATRCGAYLVNLGDKAVTVDVEALISKNGSQVYQSSINKTIRAETLKDTVYTDCSQIKLDPGEYTVSMTLKSGGNIIDHLSYTFNVVKFKKLTNKNTVSVKDGDFYLNGKKWYPLGMNYWPGASAGLENLDMYGGHWLDPEQYNPEIIERDLTLAHKLGMNLFSIQYLKVEQAPALMDFMVRAERHSIKTTLFVEGLHPLNFNLWGEPSANRFEDAGAPLLKAAHLAETPALFSYDTGWEVHLGRQIVRKVFDKKWQDWVIDQYGTIANAEKDWGFTPETIDGVISGPKDAYLNTDGEWRVYVAAYRRFMDDEINRGYRLMRQKIKTVDRKHLIGARSGYGGTGSIGVVDRFPFDLLSGAKHLDFTSPEGYIVSGDIYGFLKGGLNAAYGRLVSGGKPIYWAEFGDAVVLGPAPLDYLPGKTPELIDHQTEYYRNMIEMSCMTDSRGLAGWWWPGGYRVAEHSDFGIINPDGTPRPSALEIQRQSKKFHTPTDIRKPDAWITIDRDKYVTGYAGVYFGGAADQFSDLFKQGKYPGVCTEGTGTTSANTRMVAVGNVPCNGTNPPKYLNSEFIQVKVNGNVVDDDSVVEVVPGKPVFIDASIGNTGEAEWLASENGGGGVYLQVEEGTNKVLLPISKDTPFLSDAVVRRAQVARMTEKETTVTLRMHVAGRTPFGEVMRVTLKPAK